MTQKPNDIEKFWEELKRRNVIQVIAAYAAVSFIILQLVDIIAQPLQLPAWTLQYLIILLCIGFVIVALFSWIYDLTSGGIKKTKSYKSVKSDKVDHISGTSNSWKIISYVSIIIIFVLIAFNVFSRKKSEDFSKLEKSIAVLPFINNSPSDSNQYFINGLMDEILYNLQKIKDLRVISRTSVEQFRNTQKSIPEIAKELNVNYILEGSGQKYGSAFSLRVQLIKAEKENHMWAESYKQEIKNVKDISSIQSQIAEKISTELKATFTLEVKQLVEKQPTENLEAYTLYKIGNYLMFQQTEDAFRKAIDNYEQAISLDSSFAMAYAGLAMSYLELSGWMVSSPSSEFIPKARDIALKALEINNNLAEAYFVIGAIKYIHEWDWNGAEKAFKRGMELDPNYIYGRMVYANFLTAMGRFEESIVICQQTLKLSPLDPVVYNELAFAMFFHGQYEMALEQYDKSLELNPNFGQTLDLLILFYAKKGLFDQAISNWRKIMELNDNNIREFSAFRLGVAGQLYGMAGRREEALTLINELNRRAGEKEYMPTSCLALIYIGLGENEKAIDLLDKGFNDKDLLMVWLKVNSVFDPLRSNERFKELLRKMGF